MPICILGSNFNCNIQIYIQKKSHLISVSFIKTLAISTEEQSHTNMHMLSPPTFAL